MHARRPTTPRWYVCTVALLNPSLSMTICLLSHYDNEASLCMYLGIHKGLPCSGGHVISTSLPTLESIYPGWHGNGPHPRLPRQYPVRHSKLEARSGRGPSCPAQPQMTFAITGLAIPGATIASCICQLGNRPSTAVAVAVAAPAARSRLETGRGMGGERTKREGTRPPSRIEIRERQSFPLHLRAQDGRRAQRQREACMQGVVQLAEP